MICLNAFHRLGQLRFRVLDDVTFIQNAVMPVHRLQTGNIVPDDLVRGNHNVVVRQFLEQFSAIPRISGVHDGLQVVRVLEDFVVPVTG